MSAKDNATFAARDSHLALSSITYKPLPRYATLRPMKLCIQIPCLNEAATLPLVLQTIPTHIDGIDSIDIVVIDDGSTDDTVAVARQLGVRQFVTHARRQGLAKSFQDGILRCLELGADIIVNTDGDNQYPSQDIPRLIAPIVRGDADIAIADRQVQRIAHFSPYKKLMQKFGTWVLNKAAGTNLPDGPSGFRAYSREAALTLNVVTRFSYAMETIVQAGQRGMAIESVTITVNPKTRESRLFNSNFEHIRRSGAAIFRAFIMYRPYALFLTTGTVLALLACVPFGRFLWFAVQGNGRGHIQSLVFGAVLMTGAIMSVVLGVIADLVRINRQLQEKNLELSRKQYLAALRRD